LSGVAGGDKPAVMVQLKMGSARATLDVVGKAAGNTVYERDVSKTAVVTVDGMLAAEERRRRVPSQGRVRVGRLQAC